ncbi:hypothetical protein ACHAXR_006971 [Thalassiosira sp. AJA248-18]
MTTPTTDANGFVTVDMPSENDIGPTVVAAEYPPENDNDESASHRQRSLLKTLWSEATSTTDLPPPLNHQLHHRRATNSSKKSPRYSRKGSNSGTINNSNNISPSKRPRSLRSGRHSHNRYRVSRGAKIAKRVWFAAFAAFATSCLIAIHVFLYRIFMGSSSTSNNSNSNSNSDTAAFGMVSKNGMPILAVEDQEFKMTLDEAHSHKLASITQHSIDTSQYTIRINTWQRNEQLLLSINHHAQCDGVKEIQVIWCDSTNEPPNEILHHSSGKVKIEKHSINSLNERFKVMIDTPTLGVLSLDDDVLRPCVALDAAFIRWTRHPEQMVGFDARTHVVEDDNEESKNNDGNNNKSKWKYGYMSTTESSNRYSITLPRASFLHRDYLDLYTMALPRPIYIYVAQNLECEDIAMSFLVSSLTNGKPPLIADYWAVKSMIKLYTEKKISGGKDHKSRRDTCVNDFAELLGLKENGEWPLQTGKLLHRDQFFAYGAEPEDWSNIDPEGYQSSQRLQDVIQQMKEVQSSSGEDRMSWLTRRKAEAMGESKRLGMIEKTKEWKERWG